ncbi:MAG: nitroreductase [Firmicutes bacterium]|nr:nitroreductase [Bacillota bacterium]
MMTREDYREILKANTLRELYDVKTDQDKELPQPDVQKPCKESDLLIDLCPAGDFEGFKASFLDTLKGRKSRRKFSEGQISFNELSFMLWSTQGVKKIVNSGYATLRTVPSAGARHPFETYIIAQNVQGLDAGLYRYLPLEHKLVFLGGIPDMSERLDDATLNQKFIAASALTFVWAAVPYRTEWRYEHAAVKQIAIDAGHICQNLYLAAEAIGAGVCAVAAYDQDRMDELIGVDGKEEFTVYLAAVGRQA